MNHTPGPWQAVKNASSKGGSHVACPTHIVANHIGEADAHLIAAAPDLLEFVKLLERAIVYDIKRYENDGDDEGARLKSMTLALVRDAIARATQLSLTKGEL